MNLESGARFENYEILTRIGAGGMGEVWLARDLRLERRVAIKILPAHLAEDSARVTRLRREARAASALNHPNVCTIHELGMTNDGRLFIAMEFIEGSTLRDRLHDTPLPIREAIEIATQIASGLAAAHAAGVIHRDIKPENVMIRSDGLVKVLDFGLATLDPAASSFDRDGITRTALPTDGFAAGTMAYMSPEQARGEVLDARSDIFSLGIVMYEMVTGRQPFAGPSAAIVHDGILNRTPIPPLRLNPDVPPRLEDIVMKALEKDRALRYQNTSELRTDLVRLKRDTDPPPLAAHGAVDAIGIRTVSHRSHRVALVLGLSLAALCALALVNRRGLWALFSSPEWQELQLTTNSSENPVNAAAISPDGKYLAYSDETGIHLRLIDSGETHTIAAPDIRNINRVLWFPDGSKLVVSGAGAVEGARPAIWSVSIVGGAPRKLRDDGLEASVSPDGSQIAFVDVSREHVWLMGVNGEDPQRIVNGSAGETFHLPGFWGSRVRYARVRAVPDGSGSVKVEISAESRDRDGHTSVSISNPGLRAGVHLPDGRWLYSLVAEPTLNRDASLWEAHVDPQTAHLSAQRKIREWPGSVSLWEFTSSADGTRVAFLKRNLQKDVYLADLTSDGSVINPRRFTLDDSTDFATNWTADSKAILFSSDRNGTFDVFKQPLDKRVAEAIVSGPDDEQGPTAVSPDGGWFYYGVRPKGWRRTLAARIVLLRTPAAGGTREKVVDDDAQFHMALCAIAPSTVCVLVEHTESQLAIYSLDSEKGKGRTITTAKLSSTPGFAAISPAGSSVAVQMPMERLIRVFPLNGERPRDVAISGWSLDGSALYWSADGGGWYASGTSGPYPAGTDLLHVDLNGGVRVVRHQNVRDWMSGIPSPDGRHIALTETSTISNAWMLTNR